MIFLMPSAKNVVARAATCAPHPSPLHYLQNGVYVTHLLAVRKYGNQMVAGSELCAGRGRSLNFNFRIVSTVAAAVWGWALSWCKTSPSVSIPQCPLLFEHNTVLCTIDRLSTILLVFEDRFIEVSKQCRHHFASRRHTFGFLGPGRWRVFPLHALTLACRFIVVHPCLHACDCPLQESLSCFDVSL
jgi:hypothetical protein